MSTKTNTATRTAPKPAQIKAWFDAGRAHNILSIMRTDGISYARAVRRSRRRMVNEGVWAA